MRYILVKFNVMKICPFCFLFLLFEKLLQTVLEKGIKNQNIDFIKYVTDKRNYRR